MKLSTVEGALSALVLIHGADAAIQYRPLDRRQGIGGLPRPTVTITAITMDPVAPSSRARPDIVIPGTLSSVVNSRTNPAAEVQIPVSVSTISRPSAANAVPITVSAPSEAPVSVLMSTIPVNVPVSTLPVSAPSEAAVSVPLSTIPVNIPASTLPVDIPVSTLPVGIPSSIEPVQILQSTLAAVVASTLNVAQTSPMSGVVVVPVSVTTALSSATIPAVIGGSSKSFTKTHTVFAPAIDEGNGKPASRKTITVAASSSTAPQVVILSTPSAASSSSSSSQVTSTTGGISAAGASVSASPASSSRPSVAVSPSQSTRRSSSRPSSSAPAPAPATGDAGATTARRRTTTVKQTVVVTLTNTKTLHSSSHTTYSVSETYVIPSARPYSESLDTWHHQSSNQAYKTSSEGQHETYSHITPTSYETSVSPQPTEYESEVPQHFEDVGSVQSDNSPHYKRDNSGATKTSTGTVPSSSCPAPGSTDSQGRYSCNPAHQYPNGQMCELVSGCYILRGSSTDTAATSSSNGPAPTETSGSNKNCRKLYNQCRTAPDANMSFCASQYAGCLGYNPFTESGSSTVVSTSSQSNGNSYNLATKTQSTKAYQPSYTRSSKPTYATASGTLSSVPCPKGNSTTAPRLPTTMQTFKMPNRTASPPIHPVMNQTSSAPTMPASSPIVLSSPQQSLPSIPCPTATVTQPAPTYPAVPPVETHPAVPPLDTHPAVPPIETPDAPQPVQPVNPAPPARPEQPEQPPAVSYPAAPPPPPIETHPSPVSPVQPTTEAPPANEQPSVPSPLPYQGAADKRSPSSVALVAFAIALLM